MKKYKKLISQYQNDFSLWLKEYLKQNPDYPPIWKNMLSEISKGRKLGTFTIEPCSYTDVPKEIFALHEFMIDRIRRDEWLKIKQKNR